MNYNKLIKNLRNHTKLWDSTKQDEEKIGRILNKALYMRNNYDQEWKSKRAKAKRIKEERILFRTT